MTSPEQPTPTTPNIEQFSSERGNRYMLCRLLPDGESFIAANEGHEYGDNTRDIVLAWSSIDGATSLLKTAKVLDLPQDQDGTTVTVTCYDGTHYECALDQLTDFEALDKVRLLQVGFVGVTLSYSGADTLQHGPCAAAHGAVEVIAGPEFQTKEFYQGLMESTGDEHVKTHTEAVLAAFEQGFLAEYLAQPTGDEEQ